MSGMVDRRARGWLGDEDEATLVPPAAARWDGSSR
jgi:hypothetical protein